MHQAIKITVLTSMALMVLSYIGFLFTFRKSETGFWLFMFLMVFYSIVEVCAIIADFAIQMLSDSP